MRKLIYDCYSNQGKEKTVVTFEEANKWKSINKNNFIKEKLVDISNKNENFKINEEEMTDEKRRLIKHIKEVINKRFLKN